MSNPEKYAVSGVQRETSDDVELMIEAASEANARVKAELQGIVVTSVKQVGRESEQSEWAPQNSNANELDSASESEIVAVDDSKADAPSEPARPAEERVAVAVADSGTRDKPRATAALVIGWLLVVLVGLAAGGSWSDTDSSRSSTFSAFLNEKGVVQAAAFIFGLNLFGIIAFVLGCVVFRLRGRQAGLLLIFASLAVSVAYTSGNLRPQSFDFGGSSNDRTTEQQARRALADAADIVEQAALQPSNESSIDGLPVASKDAHGELELVVDMAATLLRQVAEDKADYIAAVAMLKLDTILLPSSLDSNEEIRRSQERLEQAQVIFVAYQEIVRKRLREARKRVETAPYSQSILMAALKGFDEGMEPVNVQLDFVFGLEEAMYEELLSLFRFLELHQDKYTVVNDVIEFESETNAVEYNAAIQRYFALAQRQININAQWIASELDYVSRIRAALNDPNAANNISPRGMVPESSGIRIELDDQSFKINGEQVSLPCPISILESHFGPPTRIEKKSNVNVVWDNRGLLAFSKLDSGMVSSLTFSLSEQPELKHFPHSQFAGKMLLHGTELFQFDTPRSFNRRADQHTFEPKDPWGVTYWMFETDDYVVHMDAGDDGTSKSIMVYSRDSFDGG